MSSKGSKVVCILLLLCLDKPFVQPESSSTEEAGIVEAQNAVLGILQSEVDSAVSVVVAEVAPVLPRGLGAGKPVDFVRQRHHAGKPDVSVPETDDSIPERVPRSPFLGFQRIGLSSFLTVLLAKVNILPMRLLPFVGFLNRV